MKPLTSTDLIRRLETMQGLSHGSSRRFVLNVLRALRDELADMPVGQRMKLRGIGTFRMAPPLPKSAMAKATHGHKTSQPRLPRGILRFSPTKSMRKRLSNDHPRQ